MARSFPAAASGPRIGIGAAINPTGGPARYAQELVRALGESEGEARFVVFTNRPEAFEIGRGIEVIEVPLRSAFQEPLWDHVLLPAAARRAGIDLYHGVKGALPLRLHCPRVVTIHDLAVYACPETFAWQQHLHMRPHVRLAAWQARRIVADSEHARRDIVCRLRLADEKVVAVPLGVRHDVFRPEAASDDDIVARRLGLPARFFLYTGTVQPRKNIDVVVRAYSRLSGLDGWELVIAGRRRPDYRPAWIDDPPAGVRYFDSPSDRELAVLFRRAVAMVSPSSYEGFGLTLLEAMASGCPVIGAGVTSVPEVVGDAGILLPAVDVEAVASAMRRIALEEGLRADLSRRGVGRSRRFTWRETARRMRAVYDEVLAGG